MAATAADMIKTIVDFDILSRSSAPMSSESNAPIQTSKQISIKYKILLS
jgi:hypothetical protein